jgi:hypothetical protein
MLKSKLILFTLPLLLLFGNSSENSVAGSKQKSPGSETGILQKMIVANGSVTMEIDLNRLNGTSSPGQKLETLRFVANANSFFTILVFNDRLRAAEAGSMELMPQNTADLPASLNASLSRLAVEKMEWGSRFDIAIRDSKTGFVFFNVEGQVYDYDANAQSLSIKNGRLLISEEFAEKLGDRSQGGALAGNISVAATMQPIQITELVNGEARSVEMPALPEPNPGTVPGPDVIVGNLTGLAQFGSAGTQVGLAVGTDSCNAGVENLNWFALPNNDHPVIPQNLYRMSGGPTNTDRFEQIGQSSCKHAFTALTQNLCGFGCNGVGGSQLGSGCSDPYSASLNAGPNLGSRGWINPFTGFFPRGDSQTPPNSHSGHVHDGKSHRILVEVNDLNQNLNAGATYFTEAQYVTKHEYDWCQTHPGQCNMYNNASYRQYNVSGVNPPFSFSAAASTVRMRPAINAWTGATSTQIEPDPGNDGIGVVGYKVTQIDENLWHYEYAVYNQNLDRAIQSFQVPSGCGIGFFNVGFHAPPQHPGWANDGTQGSMGYSSTPWPATVSSGAITWSTETFAQNQNANAIRWGTMYNFRFDSNRPPQNEFAVIGFFKTGSPITVPIQGPAPDQCFGSRPPGSRPPPTPTPPP